MTGKVTTMASLKSSWREYRREAPGLLVAFVIALVLIGGIWAVWQTYADHTIIGSGDVWTVTGMLGLNVFLILWTIRREIFASYLLLGATILLELLVITFLYLS